MKPRSEFIVRLNRGNAPVQFINNACMKCYAIVPDDQASRFPSVEAADVVARGQGLKREQFTVSEFPETPKPQNN